MLVLSFWKFFNSQNDKLIFSGKTTWYAAHFGILPASAAKSRIAYN